MTTVERPARRPKPLSARQLKARIAMGQCWQHEDGTVWCVCNIYRYAEQAHIVRLEGPREHGRYPTFTELGRDYRLLEDR